MFTAIFAAFANSAEVIYDKLVLREKGLSFKHLLTVSMTAIFVVSLLFFPFLGKINNEFFSVKYIMLFIGILFVAFFYNIFYFKALEKIDLCDVEPFELLSRPVTVIMAALVFPSERSFFPLVFTIIASLALVFSRVEKRHFKVRKTTWLLIGFVALISIEAQLVKVVLEVLSPVALYSIRVGILSIIFWLLLKPRINKGNRKEVISILPLGIITFAEYIARFYSIIYFGIVQTSLFLLLSPVITLLFSKLLLKENLTLKKAIADMIIIICVAATLFIH